MTSSLLDVDVFRDPLTGDELLYVVDGPAAELADPPALRAALARDGYGPAGRDLLVRLDVGTRLPPPARPYMTFVRLDALPAPVPVDGVVVELLTAPLDPGPAAAVRRWLREAVLRGYADEAPDDDAVARCVDVLLAGSLGSLVARRGDVPLGHLTLAEATDDRTGAPLLEVVDVLVEDPDKGVRSAVQQALVAEASRVAADRGLDLVGTVVHDEAGTAARVLAGLTATGWVPAYTVWRSGAAPVTAHGGAPADASGGAAGAAGLVTVEHLERVLGLDPEDGLWRGFRHADAVHHNVAHLLLSLWADQGVDVGPAARATLARQRRRVERYRRCVDALRADGIEPRVVKGWTIGDLYPAGALRAQTDLDLVLESVPEVWRAAQVVRDELRDVDVDLTLVRGARTELYVALSTPADDPVYDKPLSVELSTVLHYGDSERVPLRPGSASDEATRNVLALCEERFQRPFHVRDCLDLALVAEQMTDWAVRGLPAAAVTYRLAPELLELLDLTVDLGAARNLLAERPRIERAARAEQDARAQGGSPPLDLRYGLLLADPRFSRAEGGATPETVAGAEVLRTPLGAFVLTSAVHVDARTEATVSEALKAQLDAAEGRGEAS